MSDEPDFVVRDRNAADPAFARFYLKPVKNEFRSEAENRPIFEDLEYVEITLPGDRRSIVLTETPSRPAASPLDTSSRSSTPGEWPGSLPSSTGVAWGRVLTACARNANIVADPSV